MMPGSVSGLISTPSTTSFPGEALAHESQRRQHAQADGDDRGEDGNLQADGRRCEKFVALRQVPEPAD